MRERDIDIMFFFEQDFHTLDDQDKQRFVLLLGVTIPICSIA